mmetsp:Transcript_6757/g.25270  ORF Transcript_6757/g.25270 Transcript_6757/m.25270 type:complete len:86 (+) Transcript_6757:1981-2238(+)
MLDVDVDERKILPGTFVVVSHTFQQKPTPNAISQLSPEIYYFFKPFLNLPATLATFTAPLRSFSGSFGGSSSLTTLTPLLSVLVR